MSRGRMPYGRNKSPQPRKKPDWEKIAFLAAMLSDYSGGTVLFDDDSGMFNVLGGNPEFTKKFGWKSVTLETLFAESKKNGGIIS